MRSVSVNITLPKAVLDRADQIIRARGFAGRSDLIQTLIREDYERRLAAGTISALPEPGPAQAPSLSRKIPPHRS